jgi:hypothetical protein
MPWDIKPVLAKPGFVASWRYQNRSAVKVIGYCADYRCSHSLAISGDAWPADVRLSDLEPKFTCSACGHRGAELRPDFSAHRQPGKWHA